MTRDTRHETRTTEHHYSLSEPRHLMSRGNRRVALTYSFDHAQEVISYHEANHPRGVALLLTIILLSGLLLVVVAASSLVSVFGQTTRVLGNSEKAYYAAESAVEEGLYKVEAFGKGIIDLTASGNLNYVDGTQVSWSRKAFVTSKIPLGRTDVRPQNATNPVISSGNALLITLPPGGSFQMDLNIIDAVNPVYPQSIRITASSSFRVVYLTTESGALVQYTYSTNNQKIPPPTLATLDPRNNERVKITNITANTETYTLTPIGGGNAELPMALVISATGVSGTEERTVEVERKSWLVY